MYIDNSLLVFCKQIFTVFRDANFKDKSFVIYYWHDMKTANGINSYPIFFTLILFNSIVKKITNQLQNMDQCHTVFYAYRMCYYYRFLVKSWPW